MVAMFFPDWDKIRNFFYSLPSKFGSNYSRDDDQNEESYQTDGWTPNDGKSSHDLLGQVSSKPGPVMWYTSGTCHMVSL